MSIITITATSLGTELVSGIPLLLRLDTNIPSTIFYTLDGSNPSNSSDVYIEPFELPTTSFVRVRVLAISGSDQGYLDVSFKTDTSELRLPRRGEATYGAGIVVDAYATPNVVTDGYSPDQYGLVNVPIRSSDYPLQDLDIRFSRTGVNGEGSGTLLSVGFTPPPKSKTISHESSSPNNNNVFFNPRSLYVVMDGRDGYEDQIYDEYMIINRPLSGTVNPVTYFNGRMLREPNPHITGGLIRTYYSAKNKLSVSYYFDFVEYRWIKSVQKFDPSVVPPGLGMRRGSGPALIFKWIYNKRSSI